MGNIKKEDIENAILEAINIIVSKKVETAGYNKTIQAMITDTTESATGKYKVQYQDSFFYAYSENVDTSYTVGTNVYVLIPNSDMSSNKRIIGAVNNLGVDYVNIISQENRYIELGNNILIDNETEFNLNSYKTEIKVLYDKSSDDNLIQIDGDAAGQYLNGAEYLKIEAQIKNNLPLEQRSQGDFGIIFALDFKNNTTEEEETKYYVLNVDRMNGNPYLFSDYTKQIGISEVDGKNFLGINSISIFTAKFPNQQENKPDDIFIRNIRMTAVEALEESQLDGYSLNIITPQGYIFNQSALTRKAIAQLRIKGNVVNNIQDIEYYWFVQNINITAASSYYNVYGGQGWKCLNQYNVIKQAQVEGNIERAPAVYDFISGDSFITIDKADVKTKQVRYKCVAIYNSKTLSKQFVMVNLDAQYRIELVSDLGTNFYFDNGEPTLTCSCYHNDTKMPSTDLYYAWGTVNSTNNFTSISNNSDTLQVSVKDIINFITYKCSIFAQETGLLIGTASIKLINSLNDENRYYIVINNGTQVFKYNTNGVSPASNQVENPIAIPALTFEVYNQKGQEVDQSLVSNSSIVWKVPVQRTLLKVDRNQGILDEEEEYIYFNGLMTLPYAIENNYYVYNNNNDISLTLEYNGMVLSAKTNFTFLKQGEAGTNGTDFVCKIVPNVMESYDQPKNSIVYYNGSSVDFNWMNAGRENGEWFKIELWHNGSLIYSGTDHVGTSTEGKQVRISKFEVLKNKYTSILSDLSDLSILYDETSESWVFDFNTESISSHSDYIQWRPADIIKATVIYDNLTYYTTLPVMVCRLWNEDYKIQLVENTGFNKVLYNSSGLKPEYDNHANFKISTKYYNGSEWQDVSLDDDIEYEWIYNGSVKKRTGLNTYIDDHQTVDIYGQTSGKWLLNYTLNDDIPKNQKKIRPVDSYDGECVTVGLSCAVKKNNLAIGWLHMPIHMMLNRFENASLNTWDGNSVNLGGENGGMIIAPQVGAGIKDNNNSFTGMFIGTAKDPKEGMSSIVSDSGVFADSGEDIGLFGYSHGNRSIFLDAKTGKAVFGKNGAGQIILDPSTNEAVIKSGNYREGSMDTAGAGMQINLTEPSIKFGSGNFSVDQNGVVRARSAYLSGITVDSSSTYDGQTMTQIKKELKDYADTEILDYKETVNAIVEGLQEQIDGQIMSWYEDYAPTLNNYPANTWCPEEDKDLPIYEDCEGTYEEHEGDIFFNKTTGYAYRFLEVTTDNWDWVQIQDTDISKAIRDAETAFALADDKGRTFTVRPYPPYDVGDLWVNAVWDDGTIILNNEIMRCRQDKTINQSFSINDWVKASNYKDLLDQFIKVDYAKDLQDISQQIDKKMETWYQTTDPSSTWDATADHEGDLWYCTATNNPTYKQDQTYRWDGTQWVKQSAPKEVFDAIDGRRRVFVSQPTTAQEYDPGDLWVNATYGATYNNDLLRCTTAKASGAAFNINHWTLASKYTDDSTFTAFRDGAYATFVTNTGNALNGKVTTFYQDDEPTAVVVGDLWIDTNDGKKLYRWNGSSWVNVQDAKIQAALDAAGDAQATADRKIVTYAQNDAPSDDLDVGDLWIETDNNNKMYRWSGSSWVAYTDTSGLQSWLTNTYANDKSDLQTQIDGKIETWSQASDPRNVGGTGKWNNKGTDVTHKGDLWYNSTSTVQKYYRWTGTEWTEITATPPTAITNTINGKANIFTGSATPSNPKEGDLWFKSDQDPIRTYVNNQWVEYNNYTDDTVINNFLDGYTGTLTAVRNQIDSKIDTWHQAADPSLTWNTSDDHTGDLWYCTATNSQTYKQNQTYRWDVVRTQGSTDIYGWIEQQAPKEVFDAIDGKGQIFVGTSFTSNAQTQDRPFPPYQKNDIWFKSNAAGTGQIYVSVQDRTSGTGSAADWQIRNRYMAEINEAKNQTIVNDQIHYLATSASSGVTTETAGWDVTTEISETLKYLWTYHTYTFGSGRSSNTTPVILGRYGDKGADGQPKYIWIKYADTPTSGMSDSPDGKKYIGIATNKTTSTESTTYNDYTWSLMKGSDGVSTVTVYLYRRSTGTPATVPTGTFIYNFSSNTLTAQSGALNSWQQAIPTGAAPLWLIMATASSTGDTDTISGTEFSSPIQIEGVDGTDGDSVRIDSQSVKYQQGDSGTQKPTGTWLNDIPSLSQGKYLWTQTIVNYSDGRSTQAYSVSRNAVNGVSPSVSQTTVRYRQTSNGSSPPVTGEWSETAPAAVPGQYIWTRTVVTYTDNKTSTSYSVSRNGTDGSSATVYDLIVSHAAVVKAQDGTYTPSSIILTAKSQTGENDLQNYTGRLVVETYDGSFWRTPAINEDAITKTYTIPTNIVITQIRCSLYKAGGTSVLLDQQIVPIVSDGAKGADGKDAYTVILTNENHTFAGDETKAIASNVDCSIIAYKGATQMAATIGTISGQPTGMSTTISNNNTKTAKFNVAVTTSMTTKNGVLTVPVTVDGKTFSMIFTYSLALKGTPGSNATSYSLITSHAAIAKAQDGTYNPTSITLTAKSQTGTESPTNYNGRFKIETTTNNSSWTSEYTSSSNESSYTYTIPANIIAIRCSLYLKDGTSVLLDQQTIPIVSEGEDAYTVILTNENYTFVGGITSAIASDESTGLNVATCEVIAYKGTTSITPTIGTISGKPTGMSTSISGTTFTVKVTTNMVTKNGVLTIPVTVNNKTFNMKFSYSLALKGDPGQDGYNRAVVSIYKRATTQPNTPTASITYTFSTGSFTAPSGWQKSIPSGTDPCYSSSISLFSQNDSASANNWSTPIKIVENGANGVSVESIVHVYYCSNTSSTPSFNESSLPVTDNTGYTGRWTLKVPTLTSTYRYLFRFDQIKYNNNTYSMTNIERDYGVEKSFELDDRLYYEDILNRLKKQGSNNGLYYVTAAEAQSTGAHEGDLYIDGTYIKAKSIAASRIDVSELSALAATIGGFEIDSTSIHTKDVNITSNADNSIGLSSVDFTRTINNSSRTGLRLAIGDKFGVTGDGIIYASNADITGTIRATSGEFGNGTNKIQIGTNGLNNVNSAIYYGMSTLNNTSNNGFYIGTDGIALGKGAFKVTAAGALTATSADITGEINATSGSIGGWTISNNTLQVNASSVVNAINSSSAQINADRVVLSAYSTTDEMNSAISTNSSSIYRGASVPTLNNLPASAWNTDDIKESHISDIYIRSNGDEYQYVKGYNGLLITFNDACETESTTYDYIVIYYQLNQQIYKTAKLGGIGASNNLAGTTVFIPSNSFWLHWHTDNSVNNYYGFSIDSIEQVFSEYPTHSTGSLPSYAVTEVSGTNYPESEHSPYSNSSDQFWKYTYNSSSTGPDYGWILRRDSEIPKLGSSIEVLTNEISLKVSTAELEASIDILNDEISSKVSAGDIASSINQTAQSVTIDATKINLGGYVTMSSANGITAINGAVITTGTLNADKINGGTLTMGGLNNTDGVIEIKNGYSNRVGRWDKDALYIGNIVYNLTNPNLKISEDGTIVSTFGSSGSSSYYAKLGATNGFEIQGNGIKAKLYASDWTYQSTDTLDPGAEVPDPGPDDPNLTPGYFGLNTALKITDTQGLYKSYVAIGKNYFETAYNAQNNQYKNFAQLRSTYAHQFLKLAYKGNDLDNERSITLSETGFTRIHYGQNSYTPYTGTFVISGTTYYIRGGIVCKRQS